MWDVVDVVAGGSTSNVTVIATKRELSLIVVLRDCGYSGSQELTPRSFLAYKGCPLP